MSHNLTVTPSNPSSTPVAVPDGGDPRTAASVIVPFQALANQIAYVWNTLTGAITATSLSVSGAVSAGTLAATNLDLTGVARYARRTTVGATSGTTTFAFANWDRVYLLASQTAAAGTVWKIDTTGARLGEEILFEHLGAGAIQIQDPSGATIGGLSHASGGTYSQTFVLYASGVLAIVAEKYKP